MKKGKYQTLTFTGLTTIIVFFGLTFIPFFKSDVGRIIHGILSILFRIFACSWISDIAKKQKRKAIGYVILAIIIPSLTLIIVGMIGDKKRATLTSYN